ncbi:hypothetical protein ACSHWO_05795 [Streptomyces sp. HUAS TT3]|uniref:hypothetical protein n=1 Tax=Streptomyces sp. HUAS TT3 TaxID=3447510 RepID=UPI003F654BCB
MSRTKYHIEDAFEVPSFSEPDELMFLGEWVTAGIQLSPLSGIRDFSGCDALPSRPRRSRPRVAER